MERQITPTQFPIDRVIQWTKRRCKDEEIQDPKAGQSIVSARASKGAAVG
jgi:hypothetical protein